MILGNVAVRQRRPKEGDLQVSHLLPVDDDRDQIDSKSLDDPLDIVNGRLGVPTSVTVDGEESQTVPAGLKCRIGTVDPAAQSDDGVIFPSLPLGLDSVHSGPQEKTAGVAGGQMGLCNSIVELTVIAFPGIIE